MHRNSQVPPTLRKRIEVQILYSPRSGLRRLPTSVGVQTRAANFGAPRRPLFVIARESALDFDHCQRAAHMLIRTSPRQLFLSFSPRALAFPRFSRYCYRAPDPDPRPRVALASSALVSTRARPLSSLSPPVSKIRRGVMQITPSISRNANIFMFTHVMMNASEFCGKT